MGRGSYPIGKHIYVNHVKRFRIQGEVYVSDRFVTMRAYDEAENRDCFLKIYELADEEDHNYNVNNILREGKFRFYYPFIEEIYESFRGENPMQDPVVGVCGEYISGQNLADYREILKDNVAKGSISEEEAEIQILRQIYEFLHAMKYYLRYANPPYLHRDLKPLNVMITPSGDVKIVDFDFAHISGSTATIYVREHEVGFTKGYTSPSVLKRTPGLPETYPGEQEEIYAAGRVLFFWLDGKDYFRPEEIRGNLNDCSEKLYWNNNKTAYGLETSRFSNKRYLDGRYKELVEIMRRMCCSPWSKEGYKTINDVVKDMKHFLVGYCGNSFKTFESYFRMPFLLYGASEAGIEEAPMVAYKVSGSFQSTQGNILLKNGMQDIALDGRTVMTVYNRNHKIYYIPAIGTEIKRGEKHKEEVREILNGDEFTVNGVRIKFTIG